MPPNLDIDRLLNNQDAKVIITGLSQPIVGYVNQETGFGASTSWGQADAGSNQESLNKVLNSFAEISNKVAGTGIAQRIIRTAASTIVDYNGTDNLSFSLNLAFFAIREEGSGFYSDVRSVVKVLAEGIFPTFEGGRNFLGAIRAPNGFSRGNANIPTGTIAIRIGRWFRTQPVFVITGFDWNFSKSVLPNGKPLYAMGSVSFMSFRVLELSEVQGFFI